MKHTNKAKIKELRKKEALALQRRVNELWKLKREQPLVPLDKPIRHGWQRYFVLRPDLIHSKYSKNLTHILGLINNTIVSPNKAFTRKDWKTGKPVPITQRLSTLPDKQGEELEPKYKRWFVRTRFMYPWSKQFYYNWVFTHPQFFVYRIRPNYLTHKQVVDGDLQSELDFIYKKLYDGKMVTLLEGYRSGWRDDWSLSKRRNELRVTISEKEQLDEDS